MSALRVYRPLPPQPWGWLPTDQFWSRAFLTPISLVYCLAYAFYFPFVIAWDLTWWQAALGAGLLHQFWGGLVERFARQWLSRRQEHMLVESPTAEEVPAPRPTQSGIDDYEDFMTRWFGSTNRLVHHVVNLAFLFFIFYPGWWTKALGVLWIIGLTKLVRASARRQRLISPVDPVLPAAPTDALDHASLPPGVACSRRSRCR